MSKLINGRTPMTKADIERVKKDLHACISDDCCECSESLCFSCQDYLRAAALLAIERLEAQQPKWISVEERLPEDYKDVLVWAVYHEEYGRRWALREVDAYCKGVGWVNTADPDVRVVTRWMLLPEPPEEDEE